MTDRSDVSRLVQAWIVVCGTLFLISAPVSGFFLMRIYREARASAGWPYVIGNITRAEVRKIDLGLTQRYKTDVQYTYQVNGRPYRGTRIRASDSDWDERGQAREALKGLEAGRTARVYYDPADPFQSLLRPGAEFPEKAMLVIPCFLLALGVGALVLPLLSQRRA